MIKKIAIANWKENPGTETRAARLFRAAMAAAGRAKNVAVAVCPPFVYLERLSEMLRRQPKARLALGSQDVFWEEKGPYTSEIGPAMLRRLGARFAIIGHSERRRWLHETDAMVNKKLKLALADGLGVVLCVGEPASVRRKGIAAAKNYVGSQLRKDLSGLRKPKSGIRGLIVAYEPIWAVGTGNCDNPEDAREMSIFIRNILKSKFSFADPVVLYGGSVDSDSIGGYVKYKEIGGALVGGASLKSGEFGKITNKISKANVQP